MNKRKYLPLLLVFFSLSILFVTIPSAMPQEVERRELTGAHSDFKCEWCHQEEVWHTAYKNITQCKLCHENTWNTVLNSEHGNFFYEGEINVISGDVEVKYCATCHNPHQPDVLRLTYTNGTLVYIPFEEKTELCIKCHII
ncbi:cytochrome c3 family protein [Thermoproteota archaeon]